MKTYVVAFCGVLLSTSALAEPVGGSAEPSSPTGAAESANQSSDHAQGEPRQICRHIQADASSRVRARRVCHTAEEWREIEDAS